MKKAVKMALIMLVGVFILAGCSKDDKETVVVRQTRVYYYGNVVCFGRGQRYAVSNEYYPSEKISAQDVVLAYVLLEGAYVPMPVLYLSDYYIFECRTNGSIVFTLDAGEGYTWNSDMTLNKIKVVVIPHEVEVTMKSKGIDLSKYEEVARYCNLPVDDVASLNVAIPE